MGKDLFALCIDFCDKSSRILRMLVLEPLWLCDLHDFQPAVCSVAGIRRCNVIRRAFPNLDLGSTKKMNLKIVPFSYSNFFIGLAFETVVVVGFFFWFSSYFPLLGIYFLLY